jgi:hypothetical protein
MNDRACQRLRAASAARRRAEQFGMARPAGLEPATHGLEGRCSVRLSYGRMLVQFSLFHSIVGEIFSVAFWPDTPELWLLDPVP